MAKVKFTKLVPEAQVPKRGKEGDAGYDLFTSKRAMIAGKSHVDVPTGIAIAMEEGYWCEIVGRSSTSKKHGLIVLQGVIDNGYRGELFVRIYNPNDSRREVLPGQRVGQMIPHEIIDLDFEEVKKLPESERGDTGFGSTGD